MAIQNTDLLLINRGGVSYKVAASNFVDKIQPNDIALVERNGSSYKVTGTNLLAGNFTDSDLFIVNRAGVSYKATGSELKTKLVVKLETATVERITGGDCGQLITCFNITLTSLNPFPEGEIQVEGIPRVFSKNSGDSFLAWNYQCYKRRLSS